MARDLVFAFHPHECLLEGDRSESGVEVKESLVGVHPQEIGDVDVVGKGGRESHHSDQRLGALHHPQGPAILTILKHILVT